MLRILIVDDEAPIRQWFTFCILNSNKGYEIVGEAENGKEALEIFKRELPDVVFTDIKMPLMDGLELAREIKQIKLNTDIIILTVYADFGLARQAIDFSVTKYLLKSESKDKDIIKILDGINQKRLEQKSKAKTNQNSGQLIKDAVLYRILGEEVFDPEQIRELFKNSNIGLDENNLFSIAVKCYTGEDLSGLNSKTVNNLFNQYVESINCFSIDKHKFLFLGNLKGVNSQLQLMDKLYKLAVSVYGHLCCSIGVSNIYQGFGCIKSVCNEAINALNQEFFKGGRSVTIYSSIDNSVISTEKIEKLKKHYIISVNNKDIVSILKISNDILSCFGSGGTQDIDYIYKTCMQIVGILYDKIQSEEIYSEFDRPDSKRLDFETEIKSKDSLTALKTWVINIIKTLTEQFYNSNYSQDAIINKAKEYIESHFDEPLSLKDVAEHVHLNPDYFSRLFKERTGQNFSLYLRMYRLNKAEHMLMHLDMKVSEVAEMVGYPNFSYFSRIFKKYMGKNASDIKSMS